jgi:hypothetical protein
MSLINKKTEKDENKEIEKEIDKFKPLFEALSQYIKNNMKLWSGSINETNNASSNEIDNESRYLRSFADVIDDYSGHYREFKNLVHKRVRNPFKIKEKIIMRIEVPLNKPIEISKYVSREVFQIWGMKLTSIIIDGVDVDFRLQSNTGQNYSYKIDLSDDELELWHIDLLVKAIKSTPEILSSIFNERLNLGLTIMELNKLQENINKINPN